MEVLVQPAIARLGKAEHPLNDPDGVFDPGPHFGLGAVFRPLHLIDNTATAAATIGEIPGFGRALSDHRPLAAIGLIPPHAGLSPVQLLGQHRAVGDIDRCRGHRMDQLAAAVNPEMRLHPEIPLVALLGLMHLGIARLLGILGRRGRTDDCCIDDRAGGHPSVPWPPSAAVPRRTAAGPDLAPPAGGGSGTPWSRREPARGRGDRAKLRSHSDLDGSAAGKALGARTMLSARQKGKVKKVSMNTTKENSRAAPAAK